MKLKQQEKQPCQHKNATYQFNEADDRNYGSIEKSCNDCDYVKFIVFDGTPGSKLEQAYNFLADLIN